MKSSLNYLFIVLLLLVTSRIIYSIPSVKLEANDWELVEEGWPVRDLDDDTPHQFYFNKDSEKRSFVFNETLIKNINAKLIEPLKIRLKYWSFARNVKPIDPREFRVYLKDHTDKYRVSEIAKYQSEFIGHWMPREYNLSSSELSTFEMELKSGPEALTAIKDLEIEYVVYNDEAKEVPKVPENGWNQFYIPPKSRPSDSADYLYMYSCGSSCKMSIDTKYFKGYENKNLHKLHIKFEFWSKSDEDRNLTAFGKIIPVKKSIDAWTPVDAILESDIISSEEINKLLSIEIPSNDDFYFAIKDITINYELQNSGKVTTGEPIICNQDKCEWTIHGNHFWSDKTSDFWPSKDSEGRYLYYPTKVDNLKELPPENDLNKCYSIEYWAADRENTVFNIQFNTKDEDTRDVILSIKPTLNDPSMQRTEFCLRDLIAIDADQFTISFNVKKQNYNHNINGFALRIINTTHTPTTSWTIESQSQSFLNAWKDLPDIKSEWVSQIPSPGHFTLTDVAKFRAYAESYYPSSAHLISKWVKYDQKLMANSLPRYKIKIVDKNQIDMFDYFTVTPKLCDSMMFCREAVIEQIQDHSGDTSFERTVDFSFVESDHLKYVKLMFYVEYFIPRHKKLKPKDIDFELELIHFGDPCYEADPSAPICPTNSLCVSSIYEPLPVKPECECGSKYTGDNCNQTNYCNTKVANDKCAGANDNGISCLNLAADFKCVCNIDEKINWNSKNKICETPQTEESTFWEKDAAGYYKPNDRKPDKLSIKLIEIEYKTSDVCIDIDYISDKEVNLTIEYSDNLKTPPLKLYDFQIIGKNELSFCVLDFLESFRDSFNILLDVSSEDPEWFKHFSIKYKTKVQNVKLHQPYLMNWMHEHFEFKKYISQHTPNHFFKELSDKTITYQVEASQNPSTAWIFSEWIKNDSSFLLPESKERNYFSYKISNEADLKRFNIIAKICFFDSKQFVCQGEQIIMSTSPINKAEHHFKSQLSVIGKDDRPFKILLKIETSDLKEDLTINFTSISIGDSCAPENVCQNSGTCKSSVPNDPNVECICKDEFGGKRCEFNNHCKADNKSGDSLCEKQPGFNPDKKCIPVSKGVFECRCPLKDYKWNAVKKRCVRNAPQRIIRKCENHNCDILTFDNGKKSFNNAFSWSHKNFPVVETLDDQILSFYYPTKTNSDFKMIISNFDEQFDGCIKFKYFVTENAKLLIKYDGKDIFKIASTYASRDSKIDWLPDRKDDEILCIRDLISDNKKEFNLSFSSTHSNEDLVAIKVQPTNLIEFEKRTAPIILPYIVQNDFMNDANRSIHDFDYQWTIRFPRKLWKSSLSSSKDSIYLEDLLTEKVKTALVMSNWIAQWAEAMQFRAKISSMNGEFNYFSLQLIVYNHLMVEVHRSKVFTNSKQEGKLRDFISIPIERTEGVFRIAIMITYNQSTVLNKKEEEILTLGPMNLGDACVTIINDQLVHRSCNSPWGECKRLEAPLDYTCNCKPEFDIDKDCENQNFCNSKNTFDAPEMKNQSHIIKYEITGSNYCKELDQTKCLPRKAGDLNFMCDCTNNDFWNYRKRRCAHQPKCPEKTCDPLTEECEEPSNVDQEAVCKCRQGFIRNNSSKECEKFNICKHNNPCGSDPNVRCYSLEDGEHKCLCSAGFLTEGSGDKIKCVSDFCSYPTLHKCDQLCCPIETEPYYNCSCNHGYKWEQNHCKPTEDCKDCQNKAFCNHETSRCQCPPGYKLKNNNECELNLEDKKFENFCPHGNITSKDNELVCTCNDDFEKHENQTCVLKSLCGTNGKGRGFCQDKSAKCLIDDTNIGHFKCACPEGKVSSRGGREIHESETENTCIDICDFHGVEAICSKFNAKCNPYLASKSNLADNLSYPLDSRKLEHEKFCDCLPGYYMDSRYGCLFAKHSVTFKLTIKNTYRYPNNVTVSAIVPQYLFYRSNGQNLNRAKRALPENFHMDIGYYRAIEEQNILNSKEDEKARQNLIKSEIIEVIKDRSLELLDLTGLVKDRNKIGIKKCEPFANTKDFYECDVVVALSKSLNDSKSDLDKMNSECRNIGPTNSKAKDICFFVQNSLVVNRANSFEFMNNEVCSDDSFCPKNSDCVKATDGSNNFECICGHNFTLKGTSFIRTQSDLYKFKIERCEAKDLCKLCPKGDNNICIQEEPKFNQQNKSYQFDYHCSCKQGYLLDNNRQCLSVCPGNCGEHGVCQVKGTDGHACVCNDGWYGDKCDKEHSEPGNGGWIAGIVILAVLVVIVAAVAAFFAKKARNASSTSGHSMDDFSRSPGRFGHENPSFHRD